MAETWSLGRIFLGDLNVSSAQYVAGYVTKKLTAPDDKRLLGRHPEFSRMSLRPGIGADAMCDVADSMLRFDLATSQTDVPVSLAHGRRTLPLGRYLRRQLRIQLGRDEKAPDSAINEQDRQMQELRSAAFEASRPLKAVVVEAFKGRIASMEAREKIYRQKKGKI